ncbi:helix-turn-helix domain-containing protein [Streptomyces sp. NPDC004065]|uniref:helix-turn-helix domain-containing protein n=1 Tax=Streptomyces sp. NPDC004065 TaxID=3364689 RepID=UPI00384A4B17
MKDFDAIDALLAGARQEVPLPAAGERRDLRERLGLSRAQVARALGVSPSTVGGWEAGRDPAGEAREKYAYFLEGARTRLEERAAGPEKPGARATAEADAEAGAQAQASTEAVVGTGAVAGAGTGVGPGAESGAGTKAAQTDAAGTAGTGTAGTGTAGTGTAGTGTAGTGTAGTGTAGAGVGGPGAGRPPWVPDAAVPDDVEVLAAPRPCVLCGAPAHHQVAGFPQHLDPAECRTPAPPASQPSQAPAAPSVPSAPSSGTASPGPSARTAPAAGAARRGRPATAGIGGRPAGPGGPARSGGPVQVVPAGRRLRAASDSPDLIGQAVAAALARHEGDMEAATAELVRRAIPDAMALLDETRKGGRYDVVAHPWLPDVLRKQSSRGADHIWEARPKWARRELPPGSHLVTALDVNGAYLSALKTHLPIGQLEHSTGFAHDRRRAGVHLITPPVWEHDADLPNPIGSRDEPGPLWVTEPTLRLLLRLSGPKYGLCEPPEIHESFTSGATENLLEKFRVALKDARDRAIAEDDEVTLEYVKAMYSKFVSTMGESHYNRELYRPDWMHLIRSQAFANLWMKAYKAYEAGLLPVRAMGTDELHVIGDWRQVFAEGRGVSEVKVKDTYTVGEEDPAPAAPDDGDD